MTRRRWQVQMIACALAIASLCAPTEATLGDYAREWTQIANRVQLASQYIRQGQELRQKILMVLDMARNTMRLPMLIFGPIMAEIGAFHSVVREGQALAYSMANLDVEFRRRFQGWGYRPGEFYREYQQWSRTTLDGTLGVLKAANLQATQMESEEQVLRQLRTMSETSEGRMQAAQVGLQLAEQQVQQLMKLRSLMLADIQSKQSFQAWQMQQATNGAAGEQRFFTPAAERTSGRTYRGGNR